MVSLNLLWLLASMQLIIVNPSFLLRRTVSLLSTQSARNGVDNNFNRTDMDVSLYSRQMLVYGESGQRSLQVSNVLLAFTRGKSVLVDEIVKNLVLFGVKQIELMEIPSIILSNNQPSLRGNQSLMSYIGSLNPAVQVVEHDSCSTLGNIIYNQSVVVVVGDSFSNLKQINKQCRNRKIPMVACNVYGTSGYVFNDLLNEDFEVVDPNGEEMKEIPLDAEVELLGSEGNTIHMVLHSIPEERHLLGIHDKIQFMSKDTIPAGILDADVIPLFGIVQEVKNPTKFIVAMNQSMEVMQKLTSSIRNGSVTIRKVLMTLSMHGMDIHHATQMKEVLRINHQPLWSQLLRPFFNPGNACLSKKKDVIQSHSLLAMMKAYDRIQSQPLFSSSNASFFQGAVEQELLLMGILPDTEPVLSNQSNKKSTPILTIKEARKYFHPSTESSSSSVLSKFLSVARYSCPATSAVLGAMTAQEIIKIVSHIHTPISQWLMFEALDSIRNDLPLNSEGGHSDSDCLHIYGKELMDELQRMNVFLVGVGAIGSELLKNFALLGVGLMANATTSSQGGGKITLTDMDHIERSNLNRQLLFRSHHIGLSKADTAAQEIKKINPHMNIVSYTTRVGPETETVFNSSFWNEIDVVTTALDNVDARRYIDEQCILYKKWMIDSGTLGTKGNTQVVIPYVSESYSSSIDSPDEAIPICTLKSFPYKPEHCVSWAKAKFEQYFNDDISMIRSYLLQYLEDSENDPSHTTRHVWMLNKPVEEIETFHKLILRPHNHSITSKSIKSHLTFPVSAKHAMDRVLQYFVDSFDADIRLLLKENPMDKLDEDGQPFWGGSRRLPAVQSFQLSDASHRDYLMSTLVMQNRLFGIHFNDKEMQSAVDDWSMKHQIDRQDEGLCWNATMTVDQMHEEILAALEAIAAFYTDQLRQRSSDQNQRSVLDYLKSMQPEPFDKVIHAFHLSGLSHVACLTNFNGQDNLTLGHVHFVQSFSNFRSKAYRINELNELEVRKLAGNIIPALCTTTALVAGLVTLEMIKIAGIQMRLREYHETQMKMASDSMQRPTMRQRMRRMMNRMKRLNTKSVVLIEQDASETFLRKEKETLLTKFRNAFINLAHPLIAFAQPVEAESYQVLDQVYTHWSVIQSPLDWKELNIKKLKEFLWMEFHVELTAVTLGDHFLYAEYLPLEEPLSMDTSMKDLILWKYDQNRTVESDLEKERVLKKDFVELQLMCGQRVEGGEGLGEEMEDVRLPNLRVKVVPEEQSIIRNDPQNEVVTEIIGDVTDQKDSVVLPEQPIKEVKSKRKKFPKNSIKKMKNVLKVNEGNPGMTKVSSGDYNDGNSTSSIDHNGDSDESKKMVKQEEEGIREEEFTSEKFQDVEKQTVEIPVEQKKSLWNKLVNQFQNLWDMQ